MAILSNRLLNDVRKEYQKKYGYDLVYINIAGRTHARESASSDAAAVLDNSARRRAYALQQSINLGEPYFYRTSPGVTSWVIALEDRRVIHGGLACSGILLRAVDGADNEAVHAEAAEYLQTHGMGEDEAYRFLAGLQSGTMDDAKRSANKLFELFYDMSGWKASLMKENKLRIQQQEQISKYIEDQRKGGSESLYAFEKERMLLANIRAGDRNAARRILNDMLASIYMTSPGLVVLRARTVELMSYLTRAAIEDNQLMEPLIARNHMWTERLVRASSFDKLSQVLMEALDDFIEGIGAHGVNRSSSKVRRAIDYLRVHYAEKITLDGVAAEVGVSRYRLSHLVKENTGSSVMQILQQIRIQHAQQMLQRTDKSCADIAYEVGYGDQSYFIRHFKRVTGVTPLKFRSSG